MHAAAITFAELTWDESWTTRDGRDRTPVIPSHEVSGTVAGLGPGADGLGATTFLAPAALTSAADDTAGFKAVAPDGFDVVIDTVGGAVLDASYGLTRRGGRLVTLSAPPSADKAAALGVHAMFFVVTPDAAELARLAGLVDEGKLRPVVSQVFPLRDGRQAFESATKPHPPRQNSPDGPLTPSLHHFSSLEPNKSGAKKDQK